MNLFIVNSYQNQKKRQVCKSGVTKKQSSKFHHLVLKIIGDQTFNIKLQFFVANYIVFNLSKIVEISKNKDKINSSCSFLPCHIVKKRTFLSKLLYRTPFMLIKLIESPTKVQIFGLFPISSFVNRLLLIIACSCNILNSRLSIKKYLSSKEKENNTERSYII